MHPNDPGRGIEFSKNSNNNFINPIILTHQKLYEYLI